MAVPGVDLLFVSLRLSDDPVGYSPPVGPAVRFPVRYNQRDSFQPAVFSYSNLGPQWTFDWLSYITDNPSSPMADVQCYRRGGFACIFTGFDPATQSYAYQQYDQTKLVRTSASSYELLLPDGSQLVYSQSDGSVGTSRKIFLTQMIDPAGNAVTLTYDDNLRVVALTDAIGQITTLSYDLTNDIYKITSVTDPFGRSANFRYDASSRLAEITDVIGLTSQFGYDSGSDFVNTLTTAYGTTSFTTRYGRNQHLPGNHLSGRQPGTGGVQPNLGQWDPVSDPPASIPAGMRTQDANLNYRNTYYWSRTACATGYGDFSKARIYHWLHTADTISAAGILESTKEPLEGRVWRDYPGQGSPNFVGSSSLPTHVGRVLDDGSTQLYTYTYNGFGHPTTIVDPVGRTFSYNYDANGIDVLEVRQTRAGNNELLLKMTYNSQHQPLTRTDAAGQTTTYSYNARGQVLTITDPKNETAKFTYDTNGYLVKADGPLPGMNDTVTAIYDAYGRVGEITDVIGYVVTFDYDNLDRITRISHPDGTFDQITYDRLDCTEVQDRAGGQTFFDHDNMRQMTKRTDPLGRVTLLDWCRCGALKSFTDPMGRATSWDTDVQGRRTFKHYGDGSQVQYLYENTTSRMQQVIDEKQQSTVYTYNLDDSIKCLSYGNAAVQTPNVSFTYDPNYARLASMTDGIGKTTYTYFPISGSPVLGAGRLARVDGPFANDMILYNYDELGRITNRSINGVAESWARDALGRLTNTVNALGAFAYRYDEATIRVTDVDFPGGQTSHLDYFGVTGDNRLEQITHRKADNSLISQFTYAYDVMGDITSWEQKLGSYNETWTAGYDAAYRLTNVQANQGGTNLVSTTYTYDAADNRLVEDVGGVSKESYFNALNQLVSTPSASPTNTTYEWDGAHRLTAITQGAARSEFAYDGWGRLSIVTEKSGGTVVSQRRFVWCGPQICEELDSNNNVVNRFFYAGEQRQGSIYYYFSDHLGSVREFVDGASAVRAEYSYTPFGAKTRRQGDLDSNFGYTYLLNHQPSGSLFATYRAYDPGSARWLSRDPSGEAAGLNMYSYVHNSPVARKDPLGLDDGLSSSPGGLGPQLNLNFGNLSAQLQAPWQYPGSGYSPFDLTLNLNLTQNVALLCDLSIGGLGIDVKNVGPFEFQTTLTGLKSGQEQITIDTGNPKIGLQVQGNWGPDGPAFSLGVGGTFQ